MADPYEEMALGDAQLHQDAAAGGAAPYDDFAAQDARQGGQRLRASLSQSLPVNPDKAANDQLLAAQTGVPAPVVERNPDEVARRARADEITRLSAYSPVLAAQLSDPAFARVAHDDAEALSATERVVKSLKGSGDWREYALALPSGLGQVAAQGVKNVVNMPLAGTQVIGDAIRNLVTGQQDTTAQDAFFRAFVDPAVATSEALSPGPSAGVVEKTLHGVGGAIGMLAEMVLSAGEAPVAAAGEAVPPLTQFLRGVFEQATKASAVPATAGAVETGQQVLGAGATGPEAARAAVTSYLVNTLGAVVPVSAEGQALKRFATGVLSGGVTSEAQRRLTNLALPAGAEQPFSVEDFVAQSLTMGGLGLVSGPRPQQRAAQALEDHAALQDLSSLAASSKLAQRDPANFQRMVDAAAEGGPVTDVYVDARTLANTLAQSGVRPEDAGPSVAAQLPEALASGGDVRVPVGEWAARIAPSDVGQALLPHLRTAPEALSQAEAQVFMQEDAGALKQQAEGVLAEQQGQDKFVESARTVESDLLGQLRGTGRFTEDVNKAYAGLTSSFYSALAGRLGVAPHEAYARYPLRVAAEPIVGDERTVMSQPALDKTAPVASVSDLILTGEGIKDLRESAKKYAVDHGVVGDHPNADTGWAIEVRTPSLTHAFEHFGPHQQHLVPALPEIIKNAVLVETEAPRKAGATAAVHRLYAPVEFRGRLLSVKLTVKERSGDGGKRLYDFVGLQVREPDGVQGLPDKAAEAGTAGPSSGSEVRIGDLIHPRKEFRQGEGGQRGQISFGDDITSGPSVISLLKNADLTTYVHELGHFQLEVLTHAAEQADAPAEIRADAKALLDWFGVKDLAEWRGLSVEDRRPYHEQLARGFEAFLFEGKAPSAELRSVFARLRAWMLNVYRKLTELRVDLTPEVRGVFDRLLASEDQVRAAEAERAMQPLFKTPEEAARYGVDWADYQKLGAQATAEATSELSRRSLRDMRWLEGARGRALRELQREASDRRKEVVAEVRGEVRAEPAYAAARFLRRGEVQRDGQEVKIEQGHKLSLEALREMYPKGELGAIDYKKLGTGKYGMLAAEGLHPDLVAKVFGFTSGDHMVRALLEAEPEDAVVQAGADRRMLERYGDLVDPAAVARAADEAVHNDLRARVVATEMHALQKTAGERRVLVGAAREFAERIVAGKRIRDLRPGQYAAAEARAARAAAGKGSLAERAARKRDQLVNLYATRAAREAQADVEKGLRYFRRLDGRAAREAIDPDYRDQVDALLERFELRKVSDKEADRRRSLADWVRQQEERGLSPAIDERLLNEASRKPYREMTVEEFRGLVDAVRNVEHLGRLKDRLLQEQDARTLKQAVDAVAGSVRGNATKSIAERTSTDRRILPRLQALYRGAAAVQRKFASLAREMDGGQDGGPAWDLLVRGMNRAGDAEASLREQATIRLGELLAPVMKTGEKMTAGRYFASIGRSFTREERIGLALNAGNEVNRERVMTGERLSPAQYQEVLDSLSREEWDLVQGSWDYLESLRPQIAAKERRLTGVEPTWVEPTPVQTPHGEKRGGYYPIAYDPLLSTRSAADVDAEVQRQLQQGLYARAQTARGHLKSRVESTGRRLRYDFANVLTKHLNQVIHDLAWHEYLVDANRILRAQRVDEAVREHYGPEVMAEMRDTLRDVAVGNLGAEKGAAAINHLRYGTTIAGLGLNVFNSIQNLTGIFQSMSRVGSGWVLRGMAHWVGDASRLESSVARIHARSDFMRLRAKTMQREISELRNKVAVGDSKVQAAFFYLQHKTQLLVDVPTWWGAYEKAMAAPEATEQRAAELADQAVRDAQGSGEIAYLSGVQRGGSGLKLFTTFYSYFNTTLNLTAESAARTNFKKPGEVALFAADMALLYTIPALTSTLLRAALQGDWGDEGRLVKRVLADQISYMMGAVVLLREATAGVQAAAGVGQNFGYTGPAATRFFSDLYNLGAQAGQGDLDEAFWKSLDSVGGTLFHYPAGQINRTASGLAALVQGDTRNPLVLLSGPAPP